MSVRHCAFCHATAATLTDAMDGEWIPSYIDAGKEIDKPVCGECVEKRMKMDGGGAYVLFTLAPTCPICSQPARMELTCEICQRIVCGINCSSGRLDLPELVIWCRECRDRSIALEDDPRRSLPPLLRDDYEAFLASCLERYRIIRAGKPLFYPPGASFGTEQDFLLTVKVAWEEKPATKHDEPLSRGADRR